MIQMTELRQYFSPDILPFGALSKSPDFKCPKYLEWVRSRPCIIRKSYGVDAHHTVRKSQGICNDLSAVPLSHDLHMEYHASAPEDFEKKYNVCFKMAVIATMMEYLKLELKI
ncbi:hypothetical protein MASR1M48_16680 [Lactococcus petauri]